MKFSYSYLLLSLILTGACLSCAKVEVCPDEELTKEVCFSGVQNKTKAGDSALEINTLDILVFRKNGGVLEAYNRSQGTQVTANVTVGVPCHYYVVANAPEGVLDKMPSEFSFLASEWKLTDAEGGIAMVGGGESTFDKESSIKVYLDRLVSRVSLEGITPRFLESSYKTAEVILKRIYLINVNGTCPYSKIPAEGNLWYNKLKLEKLTGILADCLVSESGMTITGPGKISDSFVFYCCPNPVDNGVNSLTNPEWSVRNTRLVIELSIDGVANYYSIDMPAMACNTNYIVSNAVLTGPGSDHPDKPVSRSAISFLITVNSWGKDNDRNVSF